MVTDRFAFSRCYRLTEAHEFQQVFARARRSADRFFTILYAAGTHSEARLGFAVARKKFPHAVTRNRLRRIVRESFRHQRTTLGPIDIIILPQHAAGKAANDELFASLAQHWQRLRRAARPAPGTRVHTRTTDTQ